VAIPFERLLINTNLGWMNTFLLWGHDFIIHA